MTKKSSVKENAPPTIKSEEKEEISEDISNDDYMAYRTATGKKFHRDDCSYLKSKFETTKENAQAAGLRACSRCRPPE